MTLIPRLPLRTVLATLTLLALLAAGAPALRAQATGARQNPPAAPAPLSPIALPPVESRKLANGIDVAVMHDTGSAVSIGVVLDIGPAADPTDKPGLGDIVKAMLNRGTTSRTPKEIASAASALHGWVTSTFLYGPAADLDRLLPLLADQLFHPAFGQPALDQLKANAIAGVQRLQNDPYLLAAALFKTILYGAEHPYGSRQTEASIAAITREDVVAFYNTYVRPPNVHIVVVGAITADSAVAKLDRLFGTWQAGTAVPANVPPPTVPAQTTVYLLDRPGATQGVVWIGGSGPRRDAPDYAAVSVMNTILGGGPNSRLGTNLRLQHRYTEEVQSGFAFYPVPEPGAFAALAVVPVAKTDSAFLEMMRELRDIRAARPVTDEEFRTAREEMRRQLAAELKTVPQRTAALTDLVGNGLPFKYFEAVDAKLAAMTRDEVQAAAETYITPDRFAVVVIGDRATVEARLRAANVGPVVVVDRKGAPIPTP